MSAGGPAKSTSHRTHSRPITILHCLGMSSTAAAIVAKRHYTPSTSAVRQSAGVTAHPGRTFPHDQTPEWLGWGLMADPPGPPGLLSQHQNDPPVLALPLSTDPTKPPPSPHSSLPHSALPVPEENNKSSIGANIFCLLEPPRTPVLPCPCTRPVLCSYAWLAQGKDFASPH